MSDDKYIYIAVPREEFDTLKHVYYEAPSSYLKVYEGDIIESQQKEIAKLQILLNDKLTFISKGNDEDNWVMQEENIRLHEALNSIVNGNWSCSYEEGLEVWSTNKINPNKIALEALNPSNGYRPTD
jgi:hypothetical protein